MSHESGRDAVRLDGQVAIVTGAGKGLGRAYAKALAARGARVVVNNRKREPAGTPGSADTLVEEISANGGEAEANYDSVEDPEAAGRMVGQALGRWGRLDILVNNAGVDQQASLHRTPLDEFERIFRINFFGSLYLAKAALEPMRAAGYGRMLFTTSSTGFYGQHGLSSYSSSKAALIGLAKTLAQENAGRGINVHAISPFALTPMTEGHAAHFPRAPMGPEHVAPLVVWLMSDQCKETGLMLSAGSGHFGRAEVVEAPGVNLPTEPPITPEAIRENWAAIRTLDGARTFKDSIDAFMNVTPAAD